ncbi:MAG: O-antigen ligase family protein [Elusimicrobiales bacterium]|nr:O-antigen ligase family protein [Elusimicrobiales bacterium]
MIVLIFCIKVLNENKVKIKISPLHYLFFSIIVTFFVTSVLGYFLHSDFFKYSIFNENKRIWFFTIFNVLIPFIFVSQLNDNLKNKSISNTNFPYSLFFVVGWGVCWFFFKILKTSHAFFDLYGLILWIWAISYLHSKVELNYYHLIHLSILSGFYASIYGILQYFGIEIIWDKTLTPYGRRAVTTFGNPNFASSYILILIPFTLFYYSNIKNKVRKIYFIISISFFMMIFASLTRSSLIGLFFELLILYYFSRENKLISRSDFKKTIILFFAIAVLWPDQNLKFFKSGVFERIGEGIKKTVPKSILSIEKKDVYQSFHQRMMIWSCGLDMFLENPIFGKGWGNFELFYPFYQGYYLRKNPNLSELRTHANNAHNEIIEVISQTGIIGFGLCILFVISFCLHMLKNYSLAKDPFFLLVFISFLSMLIDNMLNVSMHFAVPALLFYSVIGIGVGKISQEKNINMGNLKFLLIILVLLCFVYIYQWKKYLERERYYFIGFKEMRRSNYGLAKFYLEKAFKLHKWEVNLAYELANAYVKNNELEKAISTYKTAINSNAGYDELYFNLAIVERNLGKFADAIKNFKTSLWINPLNEKSYYAYFEIVLKNLTQDIYSDYIFKDSLIIHNNDPYICWLNGYYYENIKKDINLAKKYYSLSLINEPTNPKYYSYLEKIATNDEPALKFSQIYKKIVVDNKYDIISVRDDLKHLEYLFGNTVKFRFMKAKYLFDNGNYGEAEKILTNILIEKPDFSAALKALGILYEKKGENLKASYYYKKYLEYNSANKDVVSVKN